MNYLLDTNHWSFLQRRHQAVVSHIERLPDDSRLYMSVVVQAELLSGLELLADSHRKRELTEFYEQVVGNCADILPVTSTIAERFAMIFSQLRSKGRPVDTHDMWIAATALVHDLTVVSNDDHFKFIDGLRVEDWTMSEANG